MSSQIAVIVPTYKDIPKLERCLERLLRQTLPDDCYRVVVVNNDPSQDISALSKSYPSVTFMTESKPGSYAARNLGISSTNEPIVAFTDSDCLPADDWLEEGHSTLLNGTDIVAGHVELTFSSSRLSAAECYELVFGFDQAATVELGYAATANLMSWRRCFEEAGLFDDSLMSGGDTRWTGNAVMRGFSLVYDAESVVQHPARGSLKELLLKARRVAGGRSSAGTAPRIWQIALAGWFPPQSLFTKIISHHKLSVSQKVKACSVAWLVKLQFQITCLAIALALSKPSRR